MKKQNKILEFISSNKKTLITVLIFLVIAIIGIFIFNYFKQEKDIYIDIASNDINYIYGPNNTTLVKMEKGDTLHLKIMSDINNYFIKCISDNEQVIIVGDDNNIKALNVGETYVSCKYKDNESNRIKIKVGE